MASHPSQFPVSGMGGMSPESSQWSGGEQHPGYGNGNGMEAMSPHYNDSNMLNSFNNMSKKVTRDGQPAKRRGPKPDSKPAQTRRQELNRQAQRTHRERKEQYIKALETEVARLREAFAHEAVNANHLVEQQKIVLNATQHENGILKEMLAARGVHFEAELESRKASARLTSGRDGASLSPPRIASPPHLAPPATFQANITGPPSSVGYRTQDQGLFSNGSIMNASATSPSTTHHSSSPSAIPEIQEQAHHESPSAVPDMPGIFERDPQLGVDFILALEASCRDHEEYLVRRSHSSPNEPEGALFSGHALMASCPPPSHIESTPAQQGGLKPTYPHQAPQVPLETLNRLLNLSNRIKADGFVEGGQVTPIMALQSLRGHRNYQSLTRDDVVGMIESIRNKVRCYGFGAVMEDFELRDALSTIFSTKPETYESMSNADIDDMYA